LKTGSGASCSAPDSSCSAAVSTSVDDSSRHAVRVVLTDEAGRLHAARVPPLRQGHATVEFSDLAPGGYTIDVSGLNASSPPAPVSTDVIVW